MAYVTSDVYQGMKHQYFSHTRLMEKTIYTVKTPEHNVKGYWAAKITHPVTGQEKAVILIVSTDLRTSAFVGPMLFKELVKTNNMEDFLRKPFSLVDSGFRILTDDDVVEVKGDKFPDILFTKDEETGEWVKVQAGSNFKREDRQAKLLPLLEKGDKRLRSIPNTFTTNAVFRTVGGTDFVLRSDTFSTSDRLSFIRKSKTKPTAFEALLLSGSFANIPSRFRLSEEELTKYDERANYHIDMDTREIYYKPVVVKGIIGEKAARPRRSNVILKVGVCELTLPKVDLTKYRFVPGEFMMLRNHDGSTHHVYDAVNNCFPDDIVAFLKERELLVAIN